MGNVREGRFDAGKVQLFHRQSGSGTPLVVLHGERDFTPVAIAAGSANRLEMARLEVPDGCGHFAFAERPEEVAGLVTGFVAGSEP